MTTPATERTKPETIAEAELEAVAGGFDAASAYLVDPKFKLDRPRDILDTMDDGESSGV